MGNLRFSFPGSPSFPHPHGLHNIISGSRRRAAVCTATACADAYVWRTLWWCRLEEELLEILWALSHCEGLEHTVVGNTWVVKLASPGCEFHDQDQETIKAAKAWERKFDVVARRGGPALLVGVEGRPPERQ